MSVNPSRSTPKHVIAFDVGTGTIQVAVLKDGKPFPLKGPEGTATPTAVFWNEDGSTVVGKPALRIAYRNPGRLFAAFKTSIKEEGIVGLSKDGSFTVVDAFAALFKFMFGYSIQLMPYLNGFPQFGGSKYSANELQVVVTIPAVDFGLEAISKYKLALVQAGFPETLVEDIAFHKEPYAAAHAALAERNLRGAVLNGDVFVVVDIGDGTTDMTVIEYQDGLLHSKAAHSGISDLGGSNLTAAIAELIGDSLEIPFLAFVRGKGISFDADTIPEEHRQDQFAIWIAAADVKHQLSLADIAYITIPTHKGNREVSLTLTDVEAAWQPLVKEIEKSVTNTLGDSGLNWSDVKFVVAAGGGCRTRNLTALIAKATERSLSDVLVCDDPQLAIVEGAVRMAVNTQDVSTVTSDTWGFSYPDGRTNKVVHEVYIETGEVVPADGLAVERMTTIVRSDGNSQSLALNPFIAKPTVFATKGDLLTDSEVIPLNPVNVELNLPDGEHPVAVRLRCDVEQKTRCVLSFPTLPSEEAIVTSLQLSQVASATMQAVCSLIVRVILLFDSSGSMKGRAIKDAKRACCTHAANLCSNGVEVAIVDFGGKPKTRVDFTTDANHIAEVVGQIDAGFQTNMAKGLRKASAMLDGEAKNIVIMFSDGHPQNASSTLKAALELKESAELYTIALGPHADPALLKQIASSPDHFVPVGRASDLHFAFSKIETLIYTGEAKQLIPAHASNQSWQQELIEE